MTGKKIKSKQHNKTSDLYHSLKRKETLFENDQKYFRLIMNMQEVIWTTDCKNRTTFITPNVEEIYGYSPEDIYEQGDRLWFSRIHADDVQKVKDAYKALFVEGKRFDIEYRIKRKNRKWIWLHDRSIATYEKDGVMYADGIFTDVSERKNIEEELKQSEQKFRAIFNNAADGILLADVKTKKFNAGNKMICQMLGCKAEGIKGMSVMDIHPEENLPHIIEQFERQARGGPTLAKNIPVKRSDGSVFYADINSFPITLAGRKYLIGIFRDITERKNVEQALQASECKYRDLVEEMKDVIYTLDTEGNVTSVNKAGKATFGRDPAEVIGQSFTKWIPQEHLHDAVAAFKRILGGEKITAETIMLDKQRKPHHVEFSSTPIIENDKVVGTRGILRDITERKKMEEALRESEQRYRGVVDNIGVGVSIISPNMEILFLNKQLKERFPDIDVSKSPICYKTFNKPPRDKICPYCPTYKTLKDGQVHEAITETLAGDTIINDRIISSPIKDKDGKVIAVIEMVEDITQRKKAEHELREYREKIARTERLASIGTLSASMAHELAQPLMVVTLSIEKVLARLEKMSCPDAVKEGLRDALSGASRAVSIVKGFRNRVRKNSQKIAKEVSLKSIADRTIALLSESARQARVTLSLKGMDKLPSIYSVEEDLEQLFFALTENAIQAADGKKRHHVVISGAVKDQHIELEFSDNCSGIRPENLDRIFEPFFTTKPPGERIGLGLYIVRSIVAQAGGQIRVESKCDKGSTFFITLPTNESNRA